MNGLIQDVNRQGVTEMQCKRDIVETEARQHLKDTGGSVIISRREGRSEKYEINMVNQRITINHFINL